jgi:capsular polysaccharide biosynthesis protein
MVLVRDIKEIAVHAASGRPPEVTYYPVAPCGARAMKPPLFMLGPANEAVLWQLFGETRTPAAGCYAIEDATLAPTGIAIKDGVAFHAEAFIHPRHHVVTVSDRLNAEALPVRHVAGPVAVIYGPAHETWGHWLVDLLPRLWVLHAAGFALEQLRFVVPPDLRDFATELLRLSGVRPEQFVRYAYWREVLHTDCLLLPTGLRAGNRLAPCFAAATRFWTQRALLAAGKTPRGPAAIFLSRGNAPQDRHLVNRADIEAIAAAHGLEVVRPEGLTIAEQIGLFSGVRLVCGEYGSALHNAVFAAAGAVVCALRGTARHPDFVQSGIAAALRQDIAYVFGATEGEGARQRFSIEPRYFTQALRLLEFREREEVLF